MKFLVGVANLEASFNKAHLNSARMPDGAKTNADIYANIGGFQYEQKLNNLDKPLCLWCKPRRRRPHRPQRLRSGIRSRRHISLARLHILGRRTRPRFHRFQQHHVRPPPTATAHSIPTPTFSMPTTTLQTHSPTSGTAPRQSDELYQLTDHGNIGSRTSALHATLNFGAEYTLPYYRKLIRLPQQHTPRRPLHMVRGSILGKCSSREMLLGRRKLRSRYLRSCIRLDAQRAPQGLQPLPRYGPHLARSPRNSFPSTPTPHSTSVSTSPSDTPLQPILRPLPPRSGPLYKHG